MSKPLGAHRQRPVLVAILLAGVGLPLIASWLLASPSDCKQRLKAGGLAADAAVQRMVDDLVARRVQSATAPPLSEVQALQREPYGPEERSFYMEWIEEDLSFWRDTGITEEMVDESFKICMDHNGGTLRVQIIDGRLYVTNGGPGPDGYYPQEYGPGWVSGKGRVLYMILSLIDALREFPGQIPDVDIVMQTTDAPLIWKNANPRKAPPVFAYDSRDDHVDIPWPDFGYYGHEIGILNDDKGQWVYGWDAQVQFYTETYWQPLEDRAREVVWRGRYWDGRDALRKTFVECKKYFEDRGRPEDSALLNVWDGDVDLRQMCGWRYQMYLESHAWSTNFKQKLACGAVLMTPVKEYYTFFHRALDPGVHYIEVSHDPVEMCEDTVRNVRAMNAHLDDKKAREGPARLVERAHKEVEHVRASTEPSPVEAASRASGGGGGARRLAGGGPRKKRQRYTHAWDSDLLPEELARNSREFVKRHVRMRDVRLYIRDVLREYAALQKFKPKPGPGAACYSGNLLLSDVLIPHKVDAFQLAAQYPWLTYWEPGCPKEEGKKEEEHRQEEEQREAPAEAEAAASSAEREAAPGERQGGADEPAAAAAAAAAAARPRAGGAGGIAKRAEPLGDAEKAALLEAPASDEEEAAPGAAADGELGAAAGSTAGLGGAAAEPRPLPAAGAVTSPAGQLASSRWTAAAATGALGEPEEWDEAEQRAAEAEQDGVADEGAGLAGPAVRPQQQPAAAVATTGALAARPAADAAVAQQALSAAALPAGAELQSAVQGVASQEAAAKQAQAEAAGSGGNGNVAARRKAGTAVVQQRLAQLSAKD